MIYVDSSVLLADLFAEARSPPEALWDEDLASSRLLIYEVRNRINARDLVGTHGERARGVLGRINLAEMCEPVLARVLEPFPVAVRTLDALHLATIERAKVRGQRDTPEAGGRSAGQSYLGSWIR
jgi:predicted nucleic acid-binding protein